MWYDQRGDETNLTEPSAPLQPSLVSACHTTPLANKV